MVNTNPTAGNVLRAAAAEIARNGHCKNNFRDEEGRLCMWGAIRTVLADQSTTSWSDQPAYKEIRRVFRAGFGGDASVIYPGAYWNDDPDTTGTDVEKFLLQTADRIEVAP